jgi:glycosyltransferase involved in cell wall biosynthesis
MIDFEKIDNNFEKYATIPSVLMRGNKDKIINPYITIAIPTYKRTDLFKEAIDSALNQQKVSCQYEVIVVDNDSIVDNETAKLIDSYEDDRLFYYKNTQNLGMFGNFNRCIELARGEWIAFLHDDDLIIPTYINTICKLLKRKRDIGAIMANFEYFYPLTNATNSDKAGLVKLISKWIKKYGEYRLIELLPIENVLWNDTIYGAPTCGSIFRRDYAVLAGGFDESLFPSADWFFLYKFNLRYKVYKSITRLGRYRIEQNESLNSNTIREFVIDAAHFREYSKNRYFIGSVIYKLFRYEQHVLWVDSSCAKDASQRIDDFDFICPYKLRPGLLRLYKTSRSLYWRGKRFISLLAG